MNHIRWIRLDRVTTSTKTTQASLLDFRRLEQSAACCTVVLTSLSFVEVHSNIHKLIININ